MAFTDNFNRANSATVGNSWTEENAATWEILSNKCRATSATGNRMTAQLLRPTGENFADGTIEVDFEYINNTNGEPQVHGRAQGSGDGDAYLCLINSSGVFQIRPALGGIIQSIIDSDTVSVSTGVNYRIALEMNGTSIVGRFYNLDTSTLISEISGTNSVVTGAGKAGLSHHTSGTLDYDNFNADSSFFSSSSSSSSVSSFSSSSSSSSFSSSSSSSFSSSSSSSFSSSSSSSSSSFSSSSSSSFSSSSSSSSFSSSSSSSFSSSSSSSSSLSSSSSSSSFSSSSSSSSSFSSSSSSSSFSSSSSSFSSSSSSSSSLSSSSSSSASVAPGVLLLLERFNFTLSAWALDQTGGTVTIQTLDNDEKMLLDDTSGSQNVSATRGFTEPTTKYIIEADMYCTSGGVGVLELLDPSDNVIISLENDTNNANEGSFDTDTASPTTFDWTPATYKMVVILVDPVANTARAFYTTNTGSTPAHWQPVGAAKSYTGAQLSQIRFRTDNTQTGDLRVDEVKIYTVNTFALGDSLTAGYSPAGDPRWSPHPGHGARLGVDEEETHSYPYKLGINYNPNEWIANRGTGSDESADMDDRVQTDVIDQGAITCVVLAGTNDIINGVSTSAMQTNIQSILDKLTGAGINVVLCTITPANNWSTNQNDKRNTMNAWIAGRADGNSIKIADTYTAVRHSTDPDLINPAYKDSSNAHFNQAGLQEIADTIFAIEISSSSSSSSSFSSSSSSSSSFSSSSSSFSSSSSSSFSSSSSSSSFSSSSSSSSSFSSSSSSSSSLSSSSSSSCGPNLIDMLKVEVAAPTTSSTTLEDMTDGSNVVSTTVTLKGTSHIAAFLNLSVISNTNNSKGYYVLTINGVDSFDEIVRHHNNTSDQGSIGLVFRTATALPPGAYIVKARWRTDSGVTLTGSNATLLAMPLEDCEGNAIPSQLAFITNDTTTSTTLEDIDGLTHDLTLSNQSKIYAVLASTISADANGTVSTIGLDVVGVQNVGERVGHQAGNEGSFGACNLSENVHSGSGNTVKGVWSTEATDTSTISPAYLLSFGLEVLGRTIPSNFVVVANDTTTSTTIEDIDSLTMTITLTQAAHIMACMWLGSSVDSTPNKLGNFLINIDGVDYPVITRSHKNAGDKSNVLVHTMTDAPLLAGTYTVKGRWSTDSGVTLTGTGISLNAIAMETVAFSSSSSSSFSSSSSSSLSSSSSSSLSSSSSSSSLSSSSSSSSESSSSSSSSSFSSSSSSSFSSSSSSSSLSSSSSSFSSSSSSSFSSSSSSFSSSSSSSSSSSFSSSSSSESSSSSSSSESSSSSSSSFSSSSSSSSLSSSSSSFSSSSSSFSSSSSSSFSSSSSSQSSSSSSSSSLSSSSSSSSVSSSSSSSSLSSSSSSSSSVSSSSSSSASTIQTLYEFTGDGFFYKQPAEQVGIKLNFVHFLESAIISTRTVSADLLGTDTTTIVIDSILNDNTTVSITLRAGADGENHKITTRITDNNGRIKEFDIYMNVVEK